MNINKVQLIGRVTKQPEKKTLPSGSSVCTFSLATNRVWNENNSTSKKEETTFHNIVVFGKVAETISRFVTKGQELYIEGRISNRSFDKKDGTKGYRSEVILETFQFGQRAKGSETGNKDEGDTIEYPESEDVNLDDIPF